MENELDLDQLVKLTNQLQAAGSARPYDTVEYDRIVDELNTLVNPQPVEIKVKWRHRIWKFVSTQIPW